MGWAVIHADDYLDKGTGHFIDALRFDELKSAISTALTGAAITIMEGVCARDILSRTGLTAALFIYVARKSPAGILGDLDILDYECQPYGVELCVPDSALDREIADYHRRIRPRVGADVIYIRLEVDGS